MNFIKNILASALGFFLAFFFIVLVISAVLLTSHRETEPHIRNGSVLNISLSGHIPERMPDDPLGMLFAVDRPAVSLDNLRSNLKKAAADDRISGVWLEINMLSTPWSTLEEIRLALVEFRETSGKFVYASTDDIGFNEQGYYIATSADSIFSPPETLFLIDGFSMQALFFSDMLEKIGIKPEVVTIGEYKSAVEMFTRTDYSTENAEQLQAILNLVSDEFLTAASEKSGLSITDINQLINDAPRLSPRFGYEYGFLDSLIYREDVEAFIEGRIVDAGHSRMHLVNNRRYARVSPQSAGIDRVRGNEKIAIIYMDGMIIPQVSGPGQTAITATSFRKQLENIQDDNNFKAIVLRINSPGGAPSTSDLIWKLIREAAGDIPVIASIGPVAASGGYYIAAGADSIVASATSITGSIGVIGTKFNVQDLFTDNLGITFDELKTHEHANWLSPFRELNAVESRVFAAYAQETYETFLSRVAESRNMETEEVDRLGRGRVWTGYDARENNLVDEIGGLDKAIEIAAEKAGLTEYELEVFPRPKTIFDVFSGSAHTQIRNFLKAIIPGYEALETGHAVYKNPHHGLLLMPYEIVVR